MKRKYLLIFFVILLGSAWIVSPARADGIALAQTVQASQMAEYQLELRNDTTASHEYSLSLTGLSEKLTASFSQGGPLLNKVAVAANSFEEFFLRIEVPADTPIGHYTAQVIATREDGLLFAFPLALNVENTYAIQIISQNLNLTTFSGQEFTFDITAMNSGAAPITNVSLSVNVPAKWITQIEPAPLSTLEPGVQAVFHCRVVVPASQVAADQTLKLVLISDQAASPESTLVVRVQKSPTFFYVALAVMGLAIGGGLLYFRLKGRR